MASIEKGTVFGGRYVVQSQVGTGGMATVYRGIDSVLDRAVAIKVMLPQYANDPAFAQRFKQEAQAAAALQNPYIVQVYDWGRDEATGTYYIVMEYLRGTDLKTGIRSHGALAPRKVAQIGAQVCSALSVAHAHDIIHRDIKPQNIMIQPNGDAKVMDFGIARAKNSHLTQTNSVLGTAHYVSPEQAQGKELDATSDLYSLGVVMYEAATGKLPFDGDDAVSVALKQVNEQPVPPSEVNPNVDDRLEAVILCCMSKNPRQRFQSADELRHVLNNYINGRPLGIPSYAAPTTRLAGGATATQVLSPGDTGRTTAMRSGAVGTQRMANVGANGGAGTQRMAAQPARGSSQARGASAARGQQARGSQGRGRGGRPAGSNGVAIAAAVGVAVIAIVAVVIGLTSCGSCSNSGQSGQIGSIASTAGEKVSVPNLSNYTQAEAKNKLATEGLELGSVTEEASSTVTKGKIIRTSPASGSEVEKGSAVDIVVSAGADTVSIPNLLKMTGEEAEKALEAAGLTGQYDSSLDGYSSTVDAGLVATYTPANKQVAKGTVVRYGLSWGVDPSTVKVKVPTVADWWYEDAENAITGVELLVYEVWEYSTDKAWGIVISVDPAAQTELSKGETVTLHISQGPEPVTVGDYTGWGSDSAQAALTNLGLNSSVDTSTPAPDAASVGNVIRTDPAAGSSVEKGSWVTVYAYGAYVPPAPTSAVIPGDIAGYDGGVSGVVSALAGMGFTNIAVTTADGAYIDSSQYGSYIVSSVSGAGSDTQFSSTVTVVVTPAAPADDGSGDEPAAESDAA